ncbi:MAG: hypothetical protein GY803_25200 [Chloroflexi bacterium]|nr:hypothetical protein [Chloroflexota bacterium]
MPTKKVIFGRKRFSFAEGVQTLESMSITEKPLHGENEDQFMRRLARQYNNRHGEIEVVIKKGYPDYAIITLIPDEFTVQQ